MRTCRLGRLVALEAWKEDFAGHSARSIAEDEVDDLSLVAGKAAMVMFPDEMIAVTHGRMRG